MKIMFLLYYKGAMKYIIYMQNMFLSLFLKIEYNRFEHISTLINLTFDHVPSNEAALQLASISAKCLNTFVCMK